MANDTLILTLIRSISPKSLGRIDPPGILPMFSSAWLVIPLTHPHPRGRRTLFEGHGMGDEDPPNGVMLLRALQGITLSFNERISVPHEVTGSDGVSHNTPKVH